MVKVIDRGSEFNGNRSDELVEIARQTFGDRFDVSGCCAVYAFSVSYLGRLKGDNCFHWFTVYPECNYIVVHSEHVFEDAFLLADKYENKTGIEFTVGKKY